MSCADYRENGDELWSRFNATREQTLWYYRELVKAFHEAGGGRLTGELSRVVSRLEGAIQRRWAQVGSTAVQRLARQAPGQQPSAVE